MFRRIFYSLVTSALGLLFLIGARVRFVYFWRPPRRGAFIFASNHISHFDPPILSGNFRRKIDWIAMQELFSAGWSSAMFTALDVIPVDRKGEDRGALRTAIQRLKDGHVVGIFPEGGIRDGDQSVLFGAPVRAGVAMIGMHAGVPIVPVVILGSDRLYNGKNWLPWRRAPIWVAVGEPITADTSLPRDQVRDALLQKLGAEYGRLKSELIKKFSLTDADMPHPPRERMSEP